MDTLVGSLARDAAQLILVQVLSASELNPRLAGGLRLTAAEDVRRARELRVDHAAIVRYRRRLEAHMAALERAALRARATVLRLEVPDEDSDDRRDLDRVASLLLGAGVMEVA
jgi:hypothetical protein